ncbi:MAG: hypothetical protein ACM3JJ_04640 [Hyphomicrobiales bacterium]
MRTTIHAAVALAAASLTLAIFLVPSPVAAAERGTRSLGLYGIGLGAGLVDPEQGSSTLGVLGRLDIGDLGAAMSMHPTVEYWRKSNEVLGIKTTRRDVTAGLDLHYPLSRGEVRPYLGAGPALHFVRSTVEQGGVTAVDTATRIGADVLGGFALQRTRSTAWFLEAKYRFVKDQSAFKLFAGLNLGF